MPSEWELARLPFFQRIEEVKRGIVKLYDAFKNAEEDWLWLIEYGGGEEMPTGKIVKAESLPDSMLPDPGVTLLNKDE